MNSTNRNTGFAPATKQEIEAWNYRAALENQVKQRAKIEKKELKERKNHGT